MDVNPDEEYWQGALEMPAPLRIKVHENVLKLLLFSHHPFFPLATTELPTTPPMLIRTSILLHSPALWRLTLFSCGRLLRRRVPRWPAGGQDRLVRVELL